VLHIDNAVLQFRRAAPGADANASLTLAKQIFPKMMPGTAGIKDTLFNDALKVDGSMVDLVRFFRPIDKAPGNFAIVSN
jgi:linear primary-alkylsulfatase